MKFFVIVRLTSLYRDCNVWIILSSDPVTKSDPSAQENIVRADGHLHLMEVPNVNAEVVAPHDGCALVPDP